MGPIPPRVETCWGNDTISTYLSEAMRKPLLSIKLLADRRHFLLLLLDLAVGYAMLEVRRLEVIGGWVAA